jgi:hypothetical protein
MEVNKGKNNLLPPTTNTCLHMDVSRHILVSRYIHVETGISGRREYKIWGSMLQVMYNSERQKYG